MVIPSRPNGCEENSCSKNLATKAKDLGLRWSPRNKKNIPYFPHHPPKISNPRYVVRVQVMLLQHHPLTYLKGCLLIKKSLRNVNTSSLHKTQERSFWIIDNISQKKRGRAFTENLFLLYSFFKNLIMLFFGR